jgi:hypothetical protein
MNTEIIKAMNRKNEKHPIRNWWHKNGHKVMRIVLFPVWIPVWAVDKIKYRMYDRTKWSDERANEILSYYVPRTCSWSEESQELYFFDNGYGWSMCYAKKYLKFKDRRFWNKFNGWNGGEIRWYLLDAFELEGFTKELGNCEDGWTEIYFKKNEERA